MGGRDGIAEGVLEGAHVVPGPDFNEQPFLGGGTIFTSTKGAS